jgi:DNA polymerase-3 subunit gamma/tau
VAAPAAGGGPGTAPVAAQAPVDWAALVEQVEQTAPLVGATMRLAVRVIRLVPGELSYELAPGIAADPTADIRRALDAATGARWQVARAQGPGAPSLEEARAALAAAQAAAMHEDPLVKAVMAAFPQARIIDAPGSAEPGTQPWSRRA